MSLSCEIRKTKKQYIVVFMATIAVMMVCSAYDSPLFPYYNSSDSAIFMLIGKGITEGKIPYVDLFDHKGPVLYWIEALGWLIGKRTGIWIIETGATICSVYLILKICEELNANMKWPLVGTAIVYLTYFGRGNLCENYSVPFLYLCTYLFIKYSLSGKTRHPELYTFIYGVCFAIIAFIRINNATIICGLVLCIIIRLLRCKEYKNLFNNTIAGLTGIIVITLPVCAFFYSKNALNDMLFCTFVYNFKYAAAQVELDGAGIIQRIIIYTPVVYSVVYFGLKSLRKENNGVSWSFLTTSMFFMAVICFAELLYTNMSAHYHTIALPLYTVSIALAIPDNIAIKEINKGSRPEKTASIVGFLLISAIFLTSTFYNTCAPIYRHYLTDACYSRYEDVQNCIKAIPEKERDSVVGYEIATSWYIDSAITPCYKFYSMQHWWSSEEYDVYGQFMDYINTNFPKWIITSPYVKDKKIRSFLDENYRLVKVGKWAYYNLSR